MQRLFIDVTYALQPDLPVPDDVSRIERYVAQCLGQDPMLSVDFVVYDRARGAYRVPSDNERDSLERGPSERLKQQHCEAQQTCSVERAGAAGNITAGHEDSTKRNRRALATIVELYRRLIRAAPRSPVDEGVAPLHTAEQPVFDNDNPFHTGDVLVCTDTIHAYMDYTYFARLGEEMGIRIINLLSHVTSMSLPFLIPEPAHRAHRHWIEIGHVSECLIAPSHFSRESYDHLIAKPNDIDVPVHVAPLPNFWRKTAEGIEARPLYELEGRPFVIYCSTIEARKNHILALRLWGELRRRFSPEALPLLVLAGEWGWGVEDVRRWVQCDSRLRPHLRILNRLSDAETVWLLRNARFAIFPSLVEDSGHVASESLSFGTPVVVSNCPAFLEATEHLMPVFHPHDFMGWLGELERLIADDAYLMTLRQAAVRYRGPAYDAFAAKIRDVVFMYSNIRPSRT